MASRDNQTQQRLSEPPEEWVAALPARVVQALRAQGKTLAVAESCTGGLLAASLTAVPGCSQVFGTGVVSYSWDCKQRLLGVRRRTLLRHGAVIPWPKRFVANTLAILPAVLPIWSIFSNLTRWLLAVVSATRRMNIC